MRGLLTMLVWIALQSAAPAVRVAVETEMGRIAIEVDVAHAPITSANFLRYVNEQFYDGGRFHRAVRPDTEPRRDSPIQVIQGGINPARASSAYAAIPLERTSVTGLSHGDGAVSMARHGRGQRADRLLHLRRRSESARLRRLTKPRWPGLRGVRPRRRRHGRRAADSGGTGARQLANAVAADRDSERTRARGSAIISGCAHPQTPGHQRRVTGRAWPGRAAPATAAAAAHFPALPERDAVRPSNRSRHSFDYERRDVMIPMRDGVRLHTVVLVPKGERATRRFC